MKKWICISMLCISFMWTGCTTLMQGSGEKFTFDDKEMESKLIYYCQDKPELEAMKIRADKAHAYFSAKPKKC